MAKSSVPTEPLDVVGFYLPRKSVDWDGLVADPKTGELVKEASMTKQSFKEECDINTIVKRFEATGHIDHVNQAAARGLYEDLPTGLDLQLALDLIHQAEEGFMALPADIRAKFDNDPVKYVDYFGDPANQQEAINLGMAVDKRKVEPPPQKVEIVNPPTVEKPTE